VIDWPQPVEAEYLIKRVKILLKPAGMHKCSVTLLKNGLGIISEAKLIAATISPQDTMEFD
jgi:hypothetical protein